LTSTGKIKILLAAAMAAMALSAVGASSASATIFNAKFSSPTFKLTATGLTVKRNGGEAKTCTPSAGLEAAVSGSEVYVSNEWTGASRFTCGGSSLVMRLLARAYYDDVAGRYYLQISDYNEQTLESPWGPKYWQKTSNTDRWTWVNGSEATASTMTLNEQWIGTTTTGEKITMSGTFTAKTSSGGLVTLSH
jgi:opacity protein-like surface antigen